MNHYGIDIIEILLHRSYRVKKFNLMNKWLQVSLVNPLGFHMVDAKIVSWKKCFKEKLPAGT